MIPYSQKRKILLYNLFQNNGTAVLLEEVPGDESIKFDGSRFTGNGIDIDNRCGQAVKIDEVIFE